MVVRRADALVMVISLLQALVAERGDALVNGADQFGAARERVEIAAHWPGDFAWIAVGKVAVADGDLHQLRSRLVVEAQHFV